jgi:MFS transporter, DHA1 family, inner membrane transport protein
VNRLLWVVCLGVFATSISWRVLDPILPVLAADLNVTLGDVVLLTTAYSFPLAAMQMVFGPVGDAWGKVRVIRLSLMLVATSMLLMAVAPSYSTVLLARMLGGAFTGGVNPVSLALIGERIPYEQRQVALGRFLSAMIGGQIVGAAVSGILVDLIGWRTLFALAAAVIAGVTLMSYAMLDDSSHVPRKFTFAGAFASYRSVLGAATTWPVLVTLVFEGVLILGLIPFVAGLVLLHQAEGSTPAGLVSAPLPSAARYSASWSAASSRRSAPGTWCAWAACWWASRSWRPCCRCIGACWPGCSSSSASAFTCSTTTSSCWSRNSRRKHAAQACRSVRSFS